MARCVLVMEDNPGIGEIFQNALNAAGYKVILVSNPEEAMKLLNPLPKYPSERIDFICSAGLHWKKCYTLAMGQYGLRNVIVITGDKKTADDVDTMGAKAFEKPIVFQDVIDYMSNCCPPN